jgi:transcriptional regulator with XRE-family HTH domain
MEQAQLSRYESGRTTPSWAAFRRLLAAMGLHPRIVLEPLHADIDHAVRELRSRPRERWLSDAFPSLLVWYALTATSDVTTTGALAARLLGAPTPLHVLAGDIVLDDRGWDSVAKGARQMGVLVEEPRRRRHELVIDGDHLRQLADDANQVVHFSHELRPMIRLRGVSRPPSRRVRVQADHRDWWAEPLDRVAGAHPDLRLVVERALAYGDSPTGDKPGDTGGGGE